MRSSMNLYVDGLHGFIALSQNHWTLTYRDLSSGSDNKYFLTKYIHQYHMKFPRNLKHFQVEIYTFPPSY